jgi:hypothetical protein
MVIPIMLFGAAALGVAAMDSGKKKKGRGRTYTLDSTLPAPLRDQVLAALARESNPDKLEDFAKAIEPSYPLAATALRTKESTIRYANPADVVPNTDDPLAAVPEPARSQIAEQLGKQTSPDALESYATQLAPLYPAAATLLRVRAMQLRALSAASAAPSPTTLPALPAPPPIAAAPPAPTTTSIPTPAPFVSPIPIAAAPPIASTPLPTPPPIAAAPLPTPPPLPAPTITSTATTSPGLPTTTPSSTAPVPTPPTTILDGLDPGMPLEMRKAVLGAITAETDPAKLEGFASAIQAQYPVAAGLLVGKAQTLRAASAAATAAATPPPAPVAPPPSPSPSVALTLSPYKLGDDLTRVGRNGGRPSGWPFIVIRPSDATYPAKIAKEATGYELNYGEMTSLNPHLAPEGKWMNLVAGDALNVPWEWAPKLAARYDVRTDPGVTPSTSPVASAAPLYRSSTAASASAAPTAPLLPAAPASPTSSSPSSSAPIAPSTFTPVSTIAASSSTPAAAPAPQQVPDPLLTYVVQPGDSPSLIAKHVVHDDRRWRELVAANPKKRTTADGNFASLMPGERLTLPDSWISTALARSSAPAGGAHASFA